MEAILAKAFKTVGTVLGIVGLVATGAGAFLGAGAAIAGIGSLARIGAIASMAAGVANMASTALSSNKPAPVPKATGSVTQMLIDPNALQPYAMGEGHYAGVLRHREAWGGTVNGVENPWLFDAVVYSGGGPVQSITPQIDFGAVPAWYGTYLATNSQVGLCPEPAALWTYYSAPGWSSSHKLSGQAAVGWFYYFDPNGKRFASGLPATGAYGQWVKAYDPRLDSTFPGGSGAHRLGNEATYEWTKNPALHAGTYAYGRYQNGKRTIGIGLPADAIDWAVIAAWANVIDANNWDNFFGVVYEPGDRWQNLKDICAAGGGEPVPGGVLTFKYHAPAVALDTITEADLIEGGSVVAMQSYRDRINTIVPKYLSPAHNWEQVQAPDVSVSSYITEDGEERRQEWPFNFVTDATQAAQLAAYKLVDARELHPIELNCGPRLRSYRPGDCLALDLPQLGLDTDAIVLRRSFDPATMTTTLTLMGETPAKHAYALGLTTTPPATPALSQSAQERDETAANTADRQITIEVVRSRNYPADYTGVVVGGVLPDVITPQVKRGGYDIRADDNVHYAIATSGVTASVVDTDGSASKGLITVTAVNAIDGWIDLTVTVDGQAYPVPRIVTNRRDGMPPGFGGPGTKVASDNGFNQIYGIGYVAISDVITVTLATGESLYGTAPLTYVIGSNGALIATAKWQYSPTGAGTWTDFGAGISGTQTTYSSGYQVGGYGDFSHSVGGLAAGDYDVRLMATVDTGGLTTSFYGTATIEAKV